MFLVTLLSLALVSEAQATHGACIPLSPDKCSCRTIKDGTGAMHTKCWLSDPPECTPCLNGCNNSGECLDKPYVDEDGLPLQASKEEWCTLADIDGLTKGDCASGYNWICDDELCLDSAGTYWRTELGEMKHLVLEEVRILWTDGDFDPITGCSPNVDHPGCVSCTGTFVPPRISCSIVTLAGACSAQCDVAGCSAECD